MALSIVPASSLKKKQQSPSQSLNFDYDIYKCQYVLRVKTPNQIVGGVEVSKSCFQEMNEGFLLALVCSNGAILLHLKESSGKTTTKQVNWFQNPCKKVVGLCIEPLRCTWVLCACADSSLYLIPALAQLKDPARTSNSSSNWSQSDLSSFSYLKLLKGEPTCIVWWRTLGDQNIGIVGTQVGELVFIDLSLHKELCRTSIKEKIVNLKIMQVIKERTTHLFIYTLKRSTIQLLLESPSPKALKPSSILSQSCDLGYDTVRECDVESIINIDSQDNKEELNILSRLEILPQDFVYSLHEIADQVLFAKQDLKNNVLEVFSELKQSPQFICYLPRSIAIFSVTNKLILTISNDVDKKGRIQLFSRELSTATHVKQNLKKTDSYVEKCIQSFSLMESETILNTYIYKFSHPSLWNSVFPCSVGYKSNEELSSFLIVSNSGVMECKPRILPESYFAELCMKHDLEYSKRFGLVFNLNAPLLYEYIADKCLIQKDLQSASKFYNLSKCSPVKRASQLISFASVTDSLRFIMQTLKKLGNSLMFKDKNDLSNLAVLCYIEQIMENSSSGTFFKNLSESFKSFLYDNLDYDAMAAIDLLIGNGLLEYLFDVAKARSLIKVALEKFACFGNFQLAPSLQTMLVDGGHAETICNVFGGMFIRHMQADEAIKCLLAQPAVTKQFISLISDQLLNLSETTLLQLGRMFDPSRQFIRPLLERSESSFRKRADSYNSSCSSFSEMDEELSVSEIVVVFLKSIIALNACRRKTVFPDM